MGRCCRVLGFVHGGVGAVDELLGGGGVVWVEAGSDADAHGVQRACDGDVLGEDVCELVDDQRRCRGCVVWQVNQQDRELVAAVSGRQVLAA
jgi:hypothetical protein